MSTHVVIGHFLKAEDDINSIVHSEKFEDTVIDAGGEYYFSNHGNSVFHWSAGEEYNGVANLGADVIKEKLGLFREEIKGITDTLDYLQIGWRIIYGASTWTC